MDTQPFWIVVSAERGPAAWPCKHATQQFAIDEATRLARAHGGKFFVMEAQIVAQKQDVVVKRLADDMEIPF
jgi:hypothetical protein